MTREELELTTDHGDFEIISDYERFFFFRRLIHEVNEWFEWTTESDLGMQLAIRHRAL